MLITWYSLLDALKLTLPVELLSHLKLSIKGRHNQVQCSRDKGSWLCHKARSFCLLILHFETFSIHFQIPKKKRENVGTLIKP